MPADHPGFAAARQIALALSIVLALALAACAAPSTASPPPAEPTRPAAGAGQGLDEGTVAAAVQIDRNCSTDAECTVKNVGNCCGYYPACVNVDSPTDPEGVKAQCAKSGMASVCGFPAITSCQCVAGQCEGSSQALLE